MSWTGLIGRLLGYEDVSNIESARVSFGSAWGHASPALVLLGCLALAILAFGFYLRWQGAGHRTSRYLLATLRAIALSLLLLILADPMLELTLVSIPKPVLWLLLDGSDSMSIPDEIPEVDRKELGTAVDLSGYQATRAGSGSGCARVASIHGGRNQGKPCCPGKHDVVAAVAGVAVSRHGARGGQAVSIEPRGGRQSRPAHEWSVSRAGSEGATAA